MAGEAQDRLIVVGPLPPPPHGVSISTALVLRNPELRARFSVEHIDTSDHRSLANVGRWDSWNALHAVAALVRLARAVRGEPGIVYLPVSQGLAGLARDTLLIRIAAARGWRVAVHLRGSELGEVVEGQPEPVRAWLRSSLQRVDAAAVLGDSVRGALDGVVPPGRVVVVANGTPDPGPPGPPAEPPTGVFLSNFLPRKGVIEAMTAALRVVETHPTARFVFAGESQEPGIEERLRHLAAPYNDRIEVRSAVTGDEKQRLLSTAALMLFPPAAPEGQPRVVLEALAAGLPLVTTDRGTIAETAPDGACGFVLPDPDPEALVERMLRLFDDRDLRRRMSRNARQRFLDHYTQAVADRSLAKWLSGLVRDRQNARSGTDGFWSLNQPGFRFTTARPGTAEFFDEVERHRYSLEPHVPEVVDFPRWAARDVLEVGCGVATDGARFARAGARYKGADSSETAVSLARRRFELGRLEGRFVVAPATKLPFEDESFDLVYSHGVLHHIEHPKAAVREFMRVLCPGGEALVMLYHRDSLNYRVNIMVVRRLLAATLLVPGAVSALRRVLGEDADVLEDHRALLRENGLRYLLDKQMFLNNNTDGPGNPLSHVYRRGDARALFSAFEDVQTAVRYLNLRLYPAGMRLSRTAPARSLERRLGWHLYVRARKPEAGRETGS